MTQPKPVKPPIRLGSFSIPNQFARDNFRYIPLMSGGVPAMVNLAGTNTIRLTVGGVPNQRQSADLSQLSAFCSGQCRTLPHPTVFDNFNDGNDPTRLGSITIPSAVSRHRRNSPSRTVITGSLRRRSRRPTAMPARPGQVVSCRIQLTAISMSRRT